MATSEGSTGEPTRWPAAEPGAAKPAAAAAATSSTEPSAPSGIGGHRALTTLVIAALGAALPDYTGSAGETTSPSQVMLYPANGPGQSADELEAVNGNSIYYANFGD